MWYALVLYLEKMALSHMRKYLMLGIWNLLTGRIRDTRQQRPHLDVGWRASAWARVGTPRQGGRRGRSLDRELDGDEGVGREQGLRHLRQSREAVCVSAGGRGAGYGA